jgi:P-type Cu+ transporter
MNKAGSLQKESAILFDMKHTYAITGMTCNGCRSGVEKKLSEVPGVRNAVVDLQKAEAIIEMESHIPLAEFRSALENSHYGISLPGEAEHVHQHPVKDAPKKEGKGSGIFYCPMHCEGEKIYNKPGDCPVCGMDLVEQPSTKKTVTQYTCPMHPEVVKDEPGSCPICGMDLVPMDAQEEEEG